MWYEQLLDHHPAALLLQRRKFRLWYFLILHFPKRKRQGNLPFSYFIQKLSSFFLRSVVIFPLLVIFFSLFFHLSHTVFIQLIYFIAIYDQSTHSFYSLSFLYKVSICDFYQCGILSILVS